MGAAAPARHADGLRRARSSRPARCSTSCRRASSRSRTPASSSASPRRRRPCRSRACPSGSRRSSRSCSQDPAVESISSFIGVDGTNVTPNSGRVQINLKPLAERQPDVEHDHPAPAAQRRRTSPGIALYMQAVQDLSVEDRVSRTQYQYSLEHPDPAQLDSGAARLLDGAAPRAGAAGRRHRPAERRPARGPRDRSRHGLALRHHRADRGRHALQRVRPAAGVDDLHAAEPVPRHPRAAAALSARPDALGDLYVTTADGRQVPLQALTKVSTTNAPLTINHQAQFPSATLSFNLSPGASLGEAVQAVEDATRRSGCRPRFRAGFQGTALAFQASLANEGWLILAAIVTVYIVLGVLYESFIHPLTILSTLPSAGIGAILALIAHGQRPRHRRAHRHRAPHRHREEERDHDDRLRAGGAARARQAARGGDLSGVVCCASARS